MNDEIEHCFRSTEYHQLAPEEQVALNYVAKCLTGENLEASDDDTLSIAFNILRPCDGCLPAEEIGDDLLGDIRRKFACMYASAVELAEERLKQLGLKPHDDFAFCLEIDPSYEDTTHVAIVDFEYEKRPFCYLHEYAKGWQFSFASLKEIAQEVLKARDAILANFRRLCQPTPAERSGQEHPSDPRLSTLLDAADRVVRQWETSDLQYAVQDLDVALLQFGLGTRRGTVK